MYHIKIYNSIVEIRKEDWDALTEDNVYMCYEYLKTFEETTVFPLLPYYITINDQAKIIGASVCYFEQKNYTRIIDSVMLGRLYKHGFMKKISFLPAVICNRQRGDGTHFIFSPELKKDQIILLQNKILDEIENIAKNSKAAVCFLNVTDGEIQLMNNLRKRGYYQTFDLPSTYIDIKWTSFQGYEKYISLEHPTTKKAIRRHIRKNRNAGVVIERLQNINDHQERLLELLKMNHEKYNSSLFPLKSNYFQRVKENFGNSAVIYVAIKNGIIIGVSVELRKGSESFFSSIGVDHAKSQDDSTFFNVGYYEPIKYSSECGIKRIYYGRGLYETKIRRGCHAKDMLIFYKPQNKFINPAIKLWFAFHELWMMRKLAYIKKL